MLTLVTYIISFLHLLLHIAAVENSPPYIPTDNILLDCGAQSNTTSSDGRSWEADSDHSKFSAPNRENASFVSTASQQDSSVTRIPYMTARIFRSEFTYNFPVSPGPKFLRLYFYSAEFPGLNVTTSFFSVNANNSTLLSNFSAYLTASATRPPISHFIKEYIITVWGNQMLSLTFVPSPNSYAFINGIEIVSMPSSLYMRGDDDQPTLVGYGFSFLLQNTTNLETLYRLNVGGQEIRNIEDTGMYRTWSQDEAYIDGAAVGTVQSFLNDPIKYTPKIPAYTAPVNVYATERTMSVDSHINLIYNLTWIFHVDMRFSYLVRLHFCETPEIKKSNQRVFDIFINNQTAERQIDLFKQTGGSGIPMYRDYVIFATTQQLWLALHPNMDSTPKFADAILNGIEIFKLNNSQGILAGPNPDPLASPISPEQGPRVPKSSRNKKLSTIFPILGAVLGATTLLSLLSGCFIFHRKRRAKDSISLSSEFTKPEDTSSLLPSDLCRRFSIVEIKAATHNFDEQFLIGTGGFGNVYKGFIAGGATPAAIKRLNPSSKQGVHEFQTEIAMLSQLRHFHLVSLIGYCDDQGEMILVYEYMPYGNLRDHLYNTDNPPLSWKLRLEICLGAARGLQYLHRDAKQSIIHRDVKSSNILLDENYVAKVSDFGLSKLGPTSMSQTHVSTVVKGSFGYLDPEYYLRQQLTEKSDVYSFGVVLFEALCARPPVIQNLPKQQVSLANWGRICCQRGTLDQIIDPYLTGEIAPECLKKFGEIAKSCVSDKAIERPTMSDVVWSLEFASQLQDTTEKTNDGMKKVQKSEGKEVVSTDDEIFSGSSEQVSKSRSTMCSDGYSFAIGDFSIASSNNLLSESLDSKDDNVK
ncbi:Malectin/receptor-like protein kinase family protein, putative [Theobroma cacao]|uniref:Malectin/receptor-like protein kinase family protein, putative n=1 Tax=Theobroma cacao TaxID=3641 RepID=A0A061EGJ5_THECC|nr:Malectin/receptor-like protein kinase family protein, putative [Theobroma cacao]